MIRWYDYIAVALMAMFMFPSVILLLPPVINLTALIPMYASWYMWIMYCDKRQSMENDR